MIETVFGRHSKLSMVKVPGQPNEFRSELSGAQAGILHDRIVYEKNEK